MDFDDFKEMFVADVKEKLEEKGIDAKLSTQEVKKINDRYESLTVTPEGSNIGVNLNLEAFFESTFNGVEYSDAVDNAVEVVQEGIANQPSIDVAALTDYSQMKDKLVMEVVSKDSNRDMLENIPHKEMEDMAVVYRFELEGDGENRATILATNQLIETMGVTPEQLHQDAIHKLLRSCFRQAVKWDMMEKNPAIDATTPKYKAKEREIWTSDMLMKAIEASDDPLVRIAFHLAFTATLRIGELLGLTWDEMDISEEAISDNRAYIIVSKEVTRVSKKALETLNARDIKLIFPSTKKNNTTLRVLKTPKTESSVRKIFIPGTVARYLIDLKKEQEELKDVLGDEYLDYNLVMATSFGLPVGECYLREKMLKIIEKEGLPKVVFHSIRHTSVTYKLKLTGGDIKSVQGDSGHAQADMVTEVYSHILDEERRKNAILMEKAFYNKEETASISKELVGGSNKFTVPEGVDPELIMKVLSNPEMAALLTSMAKAMKD